MGTSEQLADFMDDGSAAGACDGYNLMLRVQSEGLVAFVDHATPLLRQRGLVRSDYEIGPY